MGVALWIAAGLVAFSVARIVPTARDGRWQSELALAVITAGALGTLATALDFGGWNEPDWRAALFACFGAFAAAGTLRALRAK